MKQSCMLCSTFVEPSRTATLAEFVKCEYSIKVAVCCKPDVNFRIPLASLRWRTSGAWELYAACVLHIPVFHEKPANDFTRPHFSILFPQSMSNLRNAISLHDIFLPNRHKENGTKICPLLRYPGSFYEDTVSIAAF